MKSKDELNITKEAAGTVSTKLHALTYDELEQVTGGKTMQQDGQQKLLSEEIENGSIKNNPFIKG